MRIIILGASVIGVTSAWYLAKAGHEVTAIDRQTGPALETSFVNAAEISPGYASSWAAPGIPMKAVKCPFGMRLPVYPVKGYSITAPIIDEGKAPISTIMDESYKIAITRLGDRIRVGGIAEISGFNNTLHERRKATLQHSVKTCLAVPQTNQRPRSEAPSPDDTGWYADPWCFHHL